MSHLKNQTTYSRLQNHDGSNLTTLAVSNADLTTIAGAVNASSQVDCNLVASSASVAVTNSHLTALGGCVTGDNKVAISGSLVAQPAVATGAAWSAATVSANDNSTAVDLQYVSQCTAMVNSSDASAFKLQVSQDNSAWFDMGQTLTFSASGTGCLNFVSGARYARLSCTSGTSLTVSAVIGGKE